MERIGDSVTRELGRFGPAAGMAKVVSAWPDAVGPEVARNAWPARLAADGTLHVATTSSPWAFELAQLAPTVLEQLRTSLGSDAPVSLRFAVGAVPESASGTAPAPAETAIAPDPEDERVAQGLAAAVDNEELRKLVQKAAAASLARARSGRPFW